MALWGISEGTANAQGGTSTGEAKPLWQKDRDAYNIRGRADHINHDRQTFANVSSEGAGWYEELTYTDSDGNTRKRTEQLVAISSGTIPQAYSAWDTMDEYDTGDPSDAWLGVPTLTGVEFVSANISSETGSTANIDAIVSFNAKVFVPKNYRMSILIANSTQAGSTKGIANLHYYGVGNGTSQLKFSTNASALNYKGVAVDDFNAISGGGGIGQIKILTGGAVGDTSALQFGGRIIPEGLTQATQHDVDVYPTIYAAPGGGLLANTWFGDGNAVMGGSATSGGAYIGGNTDVILA